MLKRLLLAACVIGALAGCGGVGLTAVVTTAAPVAQAIHAGDRQIASTPAPAMVPTASASTAPLVPVTAATPTATAAATVAASAGVPTTPASTAGARPAVAPPRNRLVGPHGLNAHVGPAYTDCTGASDVAHDSAYIDTCHTTSVLFIGHNQGVFTPLLSYVVGDVINWYDGAAVLHHLRIVAVRDVSSSVFPPVLGTYEFQTCRFTTANSSLDHDLDAVEV